MFETGSVVSVSLIVVAFFIGLISPGPDFAVVMKNSMSRGRRSGLLTALGVGSGILVHVAYCVVGIAWLIAHQPDFFKVVQVLSLDLFCWVLL